MKRPILRTAPCAVVCRGDGSAIGAIIDVDKWPHGGGVAGFGDTLPDALRSLADEIEKEVDYAGPPNLTMLQYLVEELDHSVEMEIFQIDRMWTGSMRSWMLTKKGRDEMDEPKVQPPPKPKWWQKVVEKIGIIIGQAKFGG